MLRIGDQVIWYRVKTGKPTQKLEAEIIRIQPQKVRIKVKADGKERNVERESLKRVG